MPFYDFLCKNCKAEFNLLASISEMTQKNVFCPACKSNNLEVLIKHASNIILKSSSSSCPNSHICGCGCKHN